MRGFWKRNRIIIGPMFFLFGLKEMAEHSVWALPLLLGGGIILYLRPVWLNWTRSEALLEEFSQERVDRPIPFSYRCSRMRFYSELPPEKLWETIDSEIAKANLQLGQWYGEDGEPTQRKEVWRSVRKGDRWSLKLISEEKGTSRGVSTSVSAGSGGIGASFFVGSRWSWKKSVGGIFDGQIKPFEEGSVIEGGFSNGPLLRFLWYPLIWGCVGAPVLIKNPGLIALWMAATGAHIILENLGRGSSGNEELTVATEKALIDFFGEPEILE